MRAGNEFSLLLQGSLSSAVPELEHPQERLLLGWWQGCVTTRIVPPQGLCHHRDCPTWSHWGPAGGGCWQSSSLAGRIQPHYTYGINTEISHS